MDSLKASISDFYFHLPSSTASRSASVNFDGPPPSLVLKVIVLAIEYLARSLSSCNLTFPWSRCSKVWLICEVINARNRQKSSSRKSCSGAFALFFRDVVLPCAEYRRQSLSYSSMKLRNSLKITLSDSYRIVDTLLDFLNTHRIFLISMFFSFSWVPEIRQNLMLLLEMYQNFRTLPLIWPFLYLIVWDHETRVIVLLATVLWS